MVVFCERLDGYSHLIRIESTRPATIIWILSLWDLESDQKCTRFKTQIFCIIMKTVMVSLTRLGVYSDHTIFMPRVEISLKSDPFCPWYLVEIGVITDNIPQTKTPHDRDVESIPWLKSILFQKIQR